MDLKILFIRKDKNYPLSGTCSYETTKHSFQRIVKLYKWLLKQQNGINVKLKGNYIFINELKTFCDKNGLNYNLPLHLNAFIEDNSCFLEVEQYYGKNFIVFDNSIYSKITIENNQ